MYALLYGSSEAAGALFELDGAAAEAQFERRAGSGGGGGSDSRRGRSPATMDIHSGDNGLGSTSIGPASAAIEPKDAFSTLAIVTDSSSNTKLKYSFSCFK